MTDRQLDNQTIGQRTGEFVDGQTMGGGALSISGGLVVTTKITTHKTNDIALTMAAAAAPYDHLPTELRPR